MAQFAFARLDDIDSGLTGTLSITFVIKVVWVGDELAGPESFRVLATRGTTANQLTTQVQNTIIARAAQLGSTITSADIKFLGGSLFG